MYQLFHWNLSVGSGTGLNFIGSVFYTGSPESGTGLLVLCVQKSVGSGILGSVERHRAVCVRRASDLAAYSGPAVWPSAREWTGTTRPERGTVRPVFAGDLSFGRGCGNGRMVFSASGGAFTPGAAPNSPLVDLVHALAWAAVYIAVLFYAASGAAGVLGGQPEKIPQLVPHWQRYGDGRGDGDLLRGIFLVCRGVFPVFRCVRFVGLHYHSGHVALLLREHSAVGGCSRLGVGKAACQRAEEWLK